MSRVGFLLLRSVATLPFPPPDDEEPGNGDESPDNDSQDLLRAEFRLVTDPDLIGKGRNCRNNETDCNYGESD
jgi:hypothetical protein